MNRADYKRQFNGILLKLDTLEFNSNYYAEDRANPFLTDKGIKFIVNELKDIITWLKHLYNYKGNINTKKYYLTQFETFYVLIEKNLKDSLYYELKNILNL